MEYYFKVIVDCDDLCDGYILVKAKDVIEAGRKVEEALKADDRCRYGMFINEITRTDIVKFID